MSVRKTLRECYEVRSNGEWANITLAGWERMANLGTKHEGIYYCGEITIHSSFGTWGYIWTACANPFKEFLQQVEFDYAFWKFMGTKLHRFDGEASVREMFNWIIHDRKIHSLSKDQAREAWDALEYVRSMAECGEHDFGTAMMDVARSLDERHPLRDDFADPYSWPRRTKCDAQAQGFWRQLWPLFIEALKQEEAVVAP